MNAILEGPESTLQKSYKIKEVRADRNGSSII